MKVLHVTNLFPSKDNVAYGIFVKEQIDSLKALGINCEIVFINAAKKGKAEYLKKIFEIRRRSQEVDLIHCHHTYSAFATLFFARVHKPVVTSFQGPGGQEGKSKRFYKIKRFMYEYAQKHSASYIIKNNTQTNPCYSQKEACIPNGVNLDLFKDISRLEALGALGLPNKKYVLFVSSTSLFRRVKRYDLFCEIIKIIKEKYDPKVEGLPLENEERHRMPFLFNAASVHLLTSDHEGSPNSVREALACNIPVVARDVGNVRWMLDPVDGCYVSNTDDPEILAKLTMQALSGERIKGRERLEELQLDMKRAAQQIHQVYTRILKVY